MEWTTSSPGWNGEANLDDNTIESTLLRSGQTPHDRGDLNRSNPAPDLRDLVRPSLRSVEAYDPGPSLSELRARYGISDIVKMNWNEDLFGLLPGVREAVIGELKRAPLYPEQAYSDFRDLVAERW